MEQLQLRALRREQWPRARRESRSSVGPSISVSGVRNSWLTLLKKAVFARSSAASASARVRSSSKARAAPTAVTIWSADEPEHPLVAFVERRASG